MSSLRRGHANLLCIVPILSYETVFTPLEVIQSSYTLVGGPYDPSYGTYALVAQWIEHQTSNLGVAGSSPARGTIFFTYLIIVRARVV